MNVYITGASSGIGEYLAYAYASRGYTLGISARRSERLESVATKCRELGATVHTYQLDVTSQSASVEVASSFVDSAGGIDIVIANAGVGGEDQVETGDPSHINKILEINILGVTNTVVPFIPHLKKNKSGCIAIISSIASFLPIPLHGGYSGSKAAVRYISNTLREDLSSHSISVTAVCPGFIRSEMTDGKPFSMPFLMDTDVAAEKIIGALNRRKRNYVFPWQWKFVVPFIQMFPSIIKWFR